MMNTAENPAINAPIPLLGIYGGNHLIDWVRLRPNVSLSEALGWEQGNCGLDSS